MTVKAVIAAECCNHFREGPYSMSNYCCAKDAVCPIFTPTFQRCRWFETAVLPAWPDVAAEWADMCGQEETGDITVTRQAICRNCGEAFKTTNNRQGYCSEACSVEGRKRYVREYRRHKRTPVSGAVEK